MCVFERCAAACRKHPGKIVLPDGADARAVNAAVRLKDDGLGVPFLVGNPCIIRMKAREAGVRLNGVVCVDPEEPSLIEQNVEEYCAVFQAKGKSMTREQALADVGNPLIAGSLMVKRGDADIGVSGNLSSTADVLRTGLRIIGTAQDTKTVFSVFFMVAPGGEQLFVFADCAVIPQPSSSQLAEIALGAAKSLRLLMNETPRVAMLSFSTKGSASHESIDRVREAVELVRQRDASLIVDGELQFDAAVVPEVAAQKAPGSPVGGRANILVFPSVEAGNISYKVAQRLSGYTALGPFLLGYDKGWHDLSRGCSAEDIYKISVVGMGLSRGVE